jgi:flagellar M-ring protein FliF
VLRSSQTREEESSSADSRDSQVTVNNELPGNQRQGIEPPAPNAPRDVSKKTEETANYEISRTTRTEVTEAGRVKRISAAVLVDGVYAKNDKGELVYTERSKEELERIAALVRSAVGFDEKRGDHVEVVNLRFAEGPGLLPAAEPATLFGLFAFTKDDIMGAIQLGVIVVLALVVLFTVVRPLVKRALSPEPVRESLPPPATPAPEPPPSATALVPSPPLGGSMIDVAQIQGQLHAQSVHRVGELADRNPHETANIIRQWLTEPA